MNNNRSTFVTVVAWIFIVGSSFSTAVSLLQNIMFHLVFKQEAFSRVPQNMPAGASFMLDHFQIIVLVFFLACAGMLVASVGLLKRKNWARLTFIAMLSLGVLWGLGSIVLQMKFFSSIPQVPDDPQFADFQAMHSIMQWFAAAMSIGIAVLFAWIIRKLLSGPVKREFMA